MIALSTKDSLTTIINALNDVHIKLNGYELYMTDWVQRILYKHCTARKSFTAITNLHTDNMRMIKREMILEYQQLRVQHLKKKGKSCVN